MKRKRRNHHTSVIGDIECLIEEGDKGRNVFIPDLIRYAVQGEEDVSYAFSGNTCIEQFVHALNNLTDVDNEDFQRDLIVIFHNLKGFDGNFIIEKLYRQGMRVEN